jgi:hypothetical protein
MFIDKRKKQEPDLPERPPERLPRAEGAMSADNAAKLADAARARDFILAGDARFTFRSAKTGARYTYRVTQPKDGVPHFVKVLTGSDNESDYTFLGTIFEASTYRHGRRSHIGQDAPSAKAFAWAWEHIAKGELPEALEVFHEGRCGRCGRALTTPASVSQGYGPECIKHV